MYGIDINFLSDRKLDSQTATGARRKTETPIAERIPILIGAGVGMALILASLGALLLINQQKGNVQRQIAQLDAEIARLQGQTEEIQQIQQEIDFVNQDIEVFVSVFNSIKPWSALLGEISSIVPPNVQITSIAQEGNKTLNIAGVASSYDDVNDFLLTLKNSRFLNPENTKLQASSLVSNPNRVVFNSEEGGQNQQQVEGAAVQLPEVVNYTISTELNDRPALELINALNQRGAIGLVSRMRTLEQKGAIKPQGVIKP